VPHPLKSITVLEHASRGLSSIAELLVSTNPPNSTKQESTLCLKNVDHGDNFVKT